MKIRKNINYYNILGLHPGIDSTHEDYELKRIVYLKGITSKDIKNAYRNLSKLHHPDINNGDDTKFKEIVEAYKVLSDTKMKEEYDTISVYGISYDILTELYDFKFSNDSVAKDTYDQDYNKFKKKELINILIEMEEFQSELSYERYIGCKHCDGNGLNPALVDSFDCEICDGEGEDRLGKKCLFCNGKGKASLGFDKCPKCLGERVLPVTEKIRIKKKDIKDGKLILQFKGNASKFEQGKLGNLYIKIGKV